MSTSEFTAPIQETVAYLYSLFPSGSAEAIAMQNVAADGTWAFAGLAAGPHYYVQIALQFPALAVPLTRIVGPFTVDQSGVPVAIAMKPVDLEVLESRPAKEPMDIQWVRARVFDPSSGSEVGTASVAITVGGMAVPVPWNGSEYFLEFPTSQMAEASYTVTAEDPSLGASARSWQLIADPPTFDGVITSPMGGADAGPAAAIASQPLVVAWTDEPADYVSIELFQNVGPADAGSFQLTYPDPTINGGVPAPVAPNAGMLTIPASSLNTGGTYSLNVAYSTSSCPVTADGCVSAGAIAAQTVIVSDSATDAGPDGP